MIEWSENMTDSWLMEEIEAGRACGAHDRPEPCVECAGD